MGLCHHRATRTRMKGTRDESEAELLLFLPCAYKFCHPLLNFVSHRSPFCQPGCHSQWWQHSSTGKKMTGKRWHEAAAKPESWISNVSCREAMNKRCAVITLSLSQESVYSNTSHKHSATDGMVDSMFTGTFSSAQHFFLKQDESTVWKRRKNEICCLKGAYPSNSPSWCWSTWLSTIAHYTFHQCWCNA